MQLAMSWFCWTFLKLFACFFCNLVLQARLYAHFTNSCILLIIRSWEDNLALHCCSVEKQTPGGAAVTGSVESEHLLNPLPLFSVLCPHNYTILSENKLTKLTVLLLCVLREAFRRNCLEQAAACCGHPGALLPAVCRDPAWCLCCAGPPLCLHSEPQAGPGGTSGWPDANVSRQMPQRPDLWHEHVRLRIRWEKCQLLEISRCDALRLNWALPCPYDASIVHCSPCRAPAPGPENHSSNHCPTRDHWKRPLWWGVAWQVARRGRGGEDLLL